ncbi:hypothetical protein Poly41_00720 [Novipirellula artificiosorum]|uniref:Uncharacterized protein n=2 Tax=Novipirellula artificiosorum TaxID=2528016 RepID=A0A5C6DYR0_9BACT|nr:hypothetical protein Poly41_00720 [Novipirellula artificiosorum]
MTSQPSDTEIPASANAPPRHQPGCWIYGCLGLVFFSSATLVCGGLGAYWYFKDQVEKYTASEPVLIPSIQYAPEKIKQLETHLETFAKTVESAPTEAQDLVLSSDDINALISRNEKLKGKVHLAIRDGQMVGDISVPMDNLPGGSGRYFNAKVTFHVSLENGVLIITLSNAEVKGEPVPQSMVDAIANKNLAKEIYKDPEAAKWLSRFERLRIDKDRLVLTPRQQLDPDPVQASGEPPI